MKNVLLIGSGAREHAIAKALTKNGDVNLYSCIDNKNPGIIKISKEYLTSEYDYEKILAFAIDKKIDFCFIGPEKHLENGLTDYLRLNGIKVASPTKDAAMIETDKSFMRGLLADYNIDGQIKYFETNSFEKAIEFCDKLKWNIVVKPIGLSSGKGVKVWGYHLFSEEEAKEYIKQILNDGLSGYHRVLIEEKLVGEEFTIQFFSDGYKAIPCPAVQDFKRAFDGDIGPNTGSMGSYTISSGLLPFLNSDEYNQSIKIGENVITALRESNKLFKGILYGQFMKTIDGIKIIEFNSRFGDPEAINVLEILDSNFSTICEKIINNTLQYNDIKFSNRSTIVRYFTPKGYPDSPVEKSLVEINESEIEINDSSLIYGSCDLIEDNGKIIISTTKSRTFAIVTKSKNLKDAIDISLGLIKYIKGELHFRTDIGEKSK